MSWMIRRSLILILLLAAVLTGIWLFSQRKRLGIGPFWVTALSVLHVIVGVLCVKLFAALEQLSLSGFRNMSLFGAIFFLPGFYWIGAKCSGRKRTDIFDVFTVPTVLTLACARVNCLITGCCGGRPIPGTSYRWPTREAELVFYGLLLIWLIYRTRKKETDGILWPAYMTAYGAFRFINEFFRESETGSLFHLSHLWAILSLLIGLSVLLEQNRRKSAQPNHANFVHRRKHK